MNKLEFSRIHLDKSAALSAKKKKIDNIIANVRKLKLLFKNQKICPPYYCSRMRTCLLLTSIQKIAGIEAESKKININNPKTARKIFESLKREAEKIYGEATKEYEDICGDLTKFAKKIARRKDRELIKYAPKFKQANTYKDHYLDSALIILSHTSDLNLSVVALLHELGKFYPIKKIGVPKKIIQRLLKGNKNFTEKSKDFILLSIENLDTVELKKEFGIKAIEDQILLANINQNKKKLDEFVMNKALYRCIFKLKDLISNTIKEPKLLLVTLSTYSSNLGLSEFIGREGKFFVKYFSEETLYVLNKYFELNRKNHYITDLRILSIAKEIYKDIKKNISSLPNAQDVMESYEAFEKKVELIETYYGS